MRVTDMNVEALIVPFEVPPLDVDIERRLIFQSTGEKSAVDTYSIRMDFG